MLAEHPATLRWRQAVPPLFVAGLLGLIIGAPFARTMRKALAIIVTLYSGVLGGAGVYAAVQRRDPGLAIGLPAAIATMHLGWGSGFLWSACTWLKERVFSVSNGHTR